MHAIRSPSDPPRPRVFAKESKPRGFTLIELIFVLAIIGIVLAVTAPEFRFFIAGRGAANAANRLVALARHARAQAIAEGRTYRLNVDTEAGTYWLDAQSGAGFKELGTDFGQHFQLPDGTKATWTGGDGPIAAAAAATGAHARAPQPAQSVQFFSDGRCEMRVLHLAASSGVDAELGAPSETEMWRVAKDGEP